MSQLACTASKRSKGSHPQGTLLLSLGEAPEGSPESRKLGEEGGFSRVLFHSGKVHWGRASRSIFDGSFSDSSVPGQVRQADRKGQK